MSFVEESNTIPVRFPLLPRSRVRNELDSALYLTPWYKESLSGAGAAGTSRIARTSIAAGSATATAAPETARTATGSTASGQAGTAAVTGSASPSRVSTPLAPVR